MLSQMSGAAHAQQLRVLVNKIHSNRTQARLPLFSNNLMHIR